MAGFAVATGSLGVVAEAFVPTAAPTFPNPCVLDVNNLVNAVPHADYSNCDALKPGDTCYPDCLPGYTYATLSDGSHTRLSLDLSCDHTTGAFDAALNFSCTANWCDTDNIANAEDFADYSDCYNLTTGQQCTPTCITGSHVAHAASPLTLTCDPNGDFDGTNPLVCVENQCAFPYAHYNGVMRIAGYPSNGDACGLSIDDLEVPVYQGVLALDISST